MAENLVRKLKEAQEEALARLGQAQDSLWQAQQAVQVAEWELVQARAQALVVGKALEQVQAGEKIQVQVVLGELGQDSVQVKALA